MVILQSFTGGLRGLHRAYDFSVASMVAESRLAELGTEYSVVEGSRSGSDPSGEWRWEVNIVPYEDEHILFDPGAVRLYDVEVRVSWDSPGGERQLLLRSQRAVAADNAS